MPAPLVDFYSGALDHDFSKVRVHADERAAVRAQLLNAQAFAQGEELWFGRDQFAPGTDSGLQLLSHELVHTGRHMGLPVLRRQAIPHELAKSVDYGRMSDAELQARYDLIISVLSAFNLSTPETAILEEDAGRIGVELGRRSAIAAGRTFGEEVIERMRMHFVANAAAATPQSCIATLNTGVRLLFDKPAQPVGSEVQTTMAKLETAGLVGPARVIEFEDARGQVTMGVRAPDRLHESAWDVLIGLAGGDPGWSVFGLSLMDGYHSVTLSLDNTDPSRPRLYWSDQWHSRGGWQEYSRATLDSEITNLTKKWWGEHPADRKPRTRTTLWRLRATPAATLP
jgi:hypothetical protein